jgi:Cytochrome c/c1 heme lyase
VVAVALYRRFDVYCRSIVRDMLVTGTSVAALAITSSSFVTVPHFRDVCFELMQNQNATRECHVMQVEDTSEQDMDTVVSVHNTMNEKTWQQIQMWENIDGVDPGDGTGMYTCYAIHIYFIVYIYTNIYYINCIYNINLHSVCVYSACIFMM